MGNYQSWKTYQKRLQREGLRKKVLKRSVWISPLLILVVLALFFSMADLSTGWFSTILGREHDTGDEKGARWLFEKNDLADLIDTEALLCNASEGVVFRCSGEPFCVETTLDANLQGYMNKKIQAARSPLIGFVAMDPASGYIVSLIDHKKVEAFAEVGPSSAFPAASIFKIITASAAIEHGNLSADSTLNYNGRSYTLYKKQLKKGTNRYTNSVSLKDCFAKSINPAFGKLGVFLLKKSVLAEYAGRFGFNQPIPFELPVQPSRFSIDDDPYHWAEIACGFNRETLISPIHGAMIASAIVNGGKLVEPTIVKSVMDRQKTKVYCSDSMVARRVMSPKTSQEMMKLMAETISHGTSRRAFKGYRRDRVLSKLTLGGKTGSIKNETDEWLFDWFVGYGAEKGGQRKLALAVLVVHDELLRARAQEYARLALKYYFGRSSKVS